MRHRIPRIACIISAVAVACTSVTGLTVFAAEKVTKTFTPEETAALYGYSAIGELAIDENILIWCADSSGGYTATMHPQSMVYSTVTVNSAEYLAVRVYMWKDAIAARREEPSINIQASNYITLPSMYDFTVGGGCVTGNTTASTQNDLLYVKWFDNGVSQSQTTYYGQHYTIYSGQWASGSATNAAVKTYSPSAATSPVYQMYASQSAGYINFQLKLTAPGYVTLSDDAITDYGDCYVYVLYRCPTIVVDSDAVEDINAKLDTLTQDMSDIKSQLTEQDPEDATNIAERVEAVQSGSAVVSDYQAAESALLTEVSLQNPQDVYTFDGDTVIWFGHFWRFVERIPFVMTFSSVGILFAVLSYVLYGRK